MDVYAQLSRIFRGIMTKLTILILSDIHYASAPERERRGHELQVVGTPLLRLAAHTFRHFVWLRDPFAHNHLLDHVLSQSRGVDYAIANGDYSCDTAFVGVSDDAACQSARECLGKLRQEFGSRFQATIGDHELGKMSLFGGCGGLRLASWHRASRARLEAFLAGQVRPLRSPGCRFFAACPAGVQMSPRHWRTNVSHGRN